jgi:hypothetical protein
VGIVAQVIWLFDVFARRDEKLRRQIKRIKEYMEVCFKTARFGEPFCFAV